MQLAPSALHATAETLTGYLGADSWQVNELIIDGIISLEGPDDRQIGMRLLGDGSRIQLWATGGTLPADRESIEETFPLPHGRRWHTPVHLGALEADKDPGVVLYDTITDRLLPAFDAKPFYVGHRPWDPPAELEAADDAATTLADSGDTDQPGPAPAPEPQALAATAKQTRHLKADPASAELPAAEPPQFTPEPQVSAQQPESEATPAPEEKPVPKRTRRPKPAADAEPRAVTTRKRASAKPADGEPKPRTRHKRTPAKPAAAKPDVS